MAIAVSWQTIKSVLVFFGPILLPKALASYQRWRRSTRPPGFEVRRLPLSAATAIALLLTTALVFFLQTLPAFTPEDIFSTTRTRPVTPLDTVYDRLQALRQLGPADDLLRSRIVSYDARLIYLTLGPDVLLTCPFCDISTSATDSPPSRPDLTPPQQPAFLYALPTILAIHTLNIVVLAATLSSLWTTTSGLSWRRSATIVAVTLALFDIVSVYLLAVQPHIAPLPPAAALNLHTTRPATIAALRAARAPFFFWRTRTIRYLTLAALDIVVAVLLYLTATHRAFIGRLTAATGNNPAAILPAQITASTASIQRTQQSLHETVARLKALFVLRNATLRADQSNIAKSVVDDYWARERDLMRHPAVVEAVADAAASSPQGRTLRRDAARFAAQLVAVWQEDMAGICSKAGRAQEKKMGMVETQVLREMLEHALRRKEEEAEEAMGEDERKKITTRTEDRDEGRGCKSRRGDPEPSAAATVSPAQDTPRKTTSSGDTYAFAEEKGAGIGMSPMGVDVDEIRARRVPSREQGDEI